MFLPMLIMTIVLLFFSGIASVFETSLTAVNRLKIRAQGENGNKKAKKIMKLLDNYDLVITSIVMFDNFINIILPTMSLLFFMSMINNEATASMVSTMIMTVLVIICGEIIPKIFGRTQSERALYACVTPLSLLVTVLKPIAILITKITDLIKKYVFPSHVEEDDFDDEMITMINEEHEQGNLKTNQKDLITKAIIFNDKTVANIMKPKNKVVMISDEDSNQVIYKTIVDARFSRYPVYHEDTDNIIGILNEREFLSGFGKDRNFDKNESISKPYIVPDSMKISTLLPKMQNSKNQLAVVVDEYGVMQGIISVEDMIEELVGEIWDEHDDVVKKIRRIRPNQYLVESDVLLSDLNDIIKIDYDEDITIAKYILDKLERIPEIDDVVEEDNYQLIVKTIVDNSIEQVLINILYVDFEI